MSRPLDDDDDDDDDDYYYYYYYYYTIWHYITYVLKSWQIAANHVIKWLAAFEHIRGHIKTAEQRTIKEQYGDR